MDFRENCPESVSLAPPAREWKNAGSGFTHIYMHHAPPLRMTRRARGFALFAVTISLFVLSLIAAAVLRTTLATARLNTAAAQQTQARYDALSGVEMAVYEALDSLEIPPEGAVTQYQLGDTIISVRMSDEAGRIDLNEANEATLSAVFAALGASSTRAAHFAAAIADWRDADDTQTPDGAEQIAYQALGLNYGPRNGPFETLGELRQVRDMTDEIFACVFPIFTVYADSAAINTEVAAEPVLNVLRWARDNAWLGEDWSFDEPTAGEGPIQVVRTDGSGASLRMDVAVTTGARVFTYRALVRLTRTDQLPYQMLAFFPTTQNQTPQPCGM